MRLTLTSQLQIKFQRLPPHFRLRQTQTWNRRHRARSVDIRNSKWQPWKSEVKIIFEPKELAKCLQRLPGHFQPCPTQIWHLPTWSEIRKKNRSQNRKWFQFPMSGHVGSVMSESGIVKNMGWPLKPLCQLFPVKRYFHFRFSLPTFRVGFLMSADVRPCQQCHTWVRRGRKYGGSGWNCVVISFRSKVIYASFSICRFSSVFPLFLYFRSVKTRGSDVILYSVHLGN